MGDPQAGASELPLFHGAERYPAAIRVLGGRLGATWERERRDTLFLMGGSGNYTLIGAAAACLCLALGAPAQADDGLLYDRDLDTKWERAIAKLGVSLSMLSGEAGHA